MYINYKKTFQRLPNLSALWSLMLELSHNYPELVLIQGEPFLISKECELARNPRIKFRLTVRGSSKGNCVLWEELLLIEKLVCDGTLSADSSAHIEARCQTLLPALRDIIKGTDDTYARYLTMMKRTN
jgi:hypothetical protein